MGLSLLQLLKILTLRAKGSVSELDDLVGEALRLLLEVDMDPDLRYFFRRLDNDDADLKVGDPGPLLDFIGGFLKEPLFF